VSVLRGDGTGQFERQTPDIPVGTAPLALALADIDRNDVLDLLVLNELSKTVTVLLGDGAGGFVFSHTVSGFEPDVIALAVADFDGDGDPDLAVLVPNAFGDPEFGGAGSVAILLNDGTGHFGAPTTVPVGESPRAIRVADVDGDGRRDLIVGNEFGNSISVLRGTGTGTFGPKTDLVMGSVVSPLALGLGDLDRDGRLDFAVGATDGTGLWLNTTPSVLFPERLVAATTRVKALHFTELRTAVNAARTRYGLAAFNWTGAAPVAGGPVRASHLGNLRTALTELYVEAGLVPRFPATAAAGTPIRATDLNDLRAALLLVP
jgi:hypothetical protein